MKKIISFLLIATGAILLISEIGSATKNYYMQSGGIVLLMTGLFLVNTSLSSRFTESNEDTHENYQEEE
ncbi:hypothetical protein [uncultured Aquimarina sp.]|uniref:hypothetical protein n=1 Tax=uncultured Aquimarina sp. TaxID=575652 RepID=UPI00261E3436|nr:hypothetical protein [uncultured Aquimarina sp.]